MAPLKSAPGVLSVAAFGNALHVAGLDETLVLNALAPVREQPQMRIRPSRANLEDVFISLIASTPDTSRDAKAQRLKQGTQS